MVRHVVTHFFLFWVSSGILWISLVNISLLLNLLNEMKHSSPAFSKKENRSSGVHSKNTIFVGAFNYLPLLYLVFNYLPPICQ